MLTPEDLRTLNIMVNATLSDRKEGFKVTRDAQISCGTVKVYHMGQANPVIRIDLKIPN